MTGPWIKACPYLHCPVSYFAIHKQCPVCDTPADINSPPVIQLHDSYLCISDRCPVLMYFHTDVNGPRCPDCQTIGQPNPTTEATMPDTPNEVTFDRAEFLRDYRAAREQYYRTINAPPGMAPELVGARLSSAATMAATAVEMLSTCEIAQRNELSTRDSELSPIRCGNCDHPQAEHPAASSPESPALWPCEHNSCVCADFAQPGTVVELGSFEDN
jgi:hypothetical protein